MASEGCSTETAAAATTATTGLNLDDFF